MCLTNSFQFLNRHYTFSSLVCTDKSTPIISRCHIYLGKTKQLLPWDTVPGNHKDWSSWRISRQRRLGGSGLSMNGSFGLWSHESSLVGGTWVGQQWIVEIDRTINLPSRNIQKFSETSKPTEKLLSVSTDIDLLLTSVPIDFAGPHIEGSESLWTRTIGTLNYKSQDMINHDLFTSDISSTW